MNARVLLADDHVLVRQALKSLLEREGFDVVAEASDGHEALRQTDSAHPDIAVMDISMPMLNGLEAAREMRISSPNTKIILLTQHYEEQYLSEALEAGVKGYVLKSQAASDLIHAISRIIRGEVYLSPGVSAAVVEAYCSRSGRSRDRLTARERQVLQLIAEGKSTKELATVLGISTKTAESHRTRLMQKLDIHETATLVLYAVRRGIVQP
ncbi:MAG: response regulator [Candidatus Acidiferrales bacterium]